MESRDRDRYERNKYGLDYSRYEGDNRYEGNNQYNEHHHRARNLTDQFEREYQRERNDWGDNRNRYGESRLGTAYDQYRREEGGFRDHNNNNNNLEDRNERREHSDNFNRDGGRNSQYQNSYRKSQNRSNQYRNDESSRNEYQRGNIRQGYGISDFDGTSDRYNTLNSDNRRYSDQDEYTNYFDERDDYRSAHFGGSMGDSATHSDRGVPNYGTRNFSDRYSAGIGSTYGGKNYGGGTGYSGGHRGGTLGESSYGTTSGNYGGYGPMGGSTYGGGRGSSTGSTAHNSDRTINELGGF